MEQRLDQHRDLFKEVSDEWDRAEYLIKRVEQVVDGTALQATIPSINELRYAGRRLVEAIHLIVEAKDSDEVRVILREARFDCHRAQHDAIDATFRAIRVNLEAAEILLPMDAILRAFPDYTKLKSVFKSANDKVAASRENRQNREEIYESLKEIEFEETLEHYSNFLANESVLMAYAKEDRSTKFLAKLSIVGGLTVGFVGVVIAALTLSLK